MQENSEFTIVRLNNLLFGNVDDRPKVDDKGNTKVTNT
jgi:hypothetical protein